MYDDLLDDQGLQQDGGTPDPSKQGGDITPEPSQDAAPAKEPEPKPQADDAIPDVDDRGVPSHNVLSEMRKKIDQLIENQRQMSEEFTRYRTPQAGGYQPTSVPQQTQPQPQVKMPTTVEEAAEILTKEVNEKITSGEITEVTQLETFRNRRMFELNQQVQTAMTMRQTERNISNSRILEIYPELRDPQSNLSRTVLNEIQRRSSINGYNIYEKDPYCLENITPFIASRLGIQPRLNGRLHQKQPTSLPQNIGGRGTVKPPSEVIAPTEVEKVMSPKYGNDPVEMAKFNREHPDPRSISVEDVLLS